MGLDRWIAIRMELTREKENLFRFIPKSICSGVCDSELCVFQTENGNLIECATEFHEYIGIDTFYAFPIKVSELLKGNSNKTELENAIVNYFDKIRKYEHYCVASEKDGQTIYNFYSFSDVGVKNPIFLDWNAGFNDINQTKFNRQSNQNFSRSDIVEKMKRRIIGQDEQVENFVTAVLSNQKYGMYEGLKTNVLVIGSTGTGKTEMCNSLAKLLDIPVIKKDATKYSTTGYIGMSVLDILADLYRESGKNIERAEKGIVIIDEFDKLGVTGKDTSKVRTTDVQQELLGLLGNGTYDIEVDRKMVTIDTSRITFVLSGAFQNVLDELNKPNKKPLGFGSVETKLEEKTLKREDLIKKGGIEPELLRRIPIIIQMNKLYTDTLKRILEESEISNLKVWEKAFLESDNIKLVYNDEVLTAMAQKAYKTGGGASGLQTVVTNTLLDVRSKALDGNLYDCDVLLGVNTL